MTKIILKFKNTCGCDYEEQHLEIDSPKHIVNAIFDGFPICPECGEDMEYVEE